VGCDKNFRGDKSTGKREKPYGSWAGGRILRALQRGVTKTE